METKILLLEDDIYLQSLISMRCSAEQLPVRIARSGDDAMRLVTAEQFGVAVLDVMLPVKSGVDVACHIMAECPDLPFVFISAKNRAVFLDEFRDDIERHPQLRQVPYIMKPFNLNYFVNKIHHILVTGSSTDTDTGQEARRRYAV